MKKNIFVFSFLLMGTFCAVSVMAEESGVSPQDGMEYNKQDAGLGQERGGDKNRHQMMQGGKSGGMMQHNKPSLVATSDGGIVVLDGPRLLKYDAQLNLVGEAELKPGKKPAQNKTNEEHHPPANNVPDVDLPAVEEMPIAEQTTQ